MRRRQRSQLGRKQRAVNPIAKASEVNWVEPWRANRFRYVQSHAEMRVAGLPALASAPAGTLIHVASSTRKFETTNAVMALEPNTSHGQSNAFPALVWLAPRMSMSQ